MSTRTIELVTASRLVHTLMKINSLAKLPNSVFVAKQGEIRKEAVGDGVRQFCT
jgi:hypothetical protein